MRFHWHPKNGRHCLLLCFLFFYCSKRCLPCSPTQPEIIGIVNQNQLSAKWGTHTHFPTHGGLSNDHPFISCFIVLGTFWVNIFISYFHLPGVKNLSLFYENMTKFSAGGMTRCTGCCLGQTNGKHSQFNIWFSREDVKHKRSSQQVKTKVFQFPLIRRRNVFWEYALMKDFSVTM